MLFISFDKNRIKAKTKICQARKYKKRRGIVEGGGWRVGKRNDIITTKYVLILFSIRTFIMLMVNKSITAARYSKLY